MKEMFCPETSCESNSIFPFKTAIKPKTGNLPQKKKYGATKNYKNIEESNILVTEAKDDNSTRPYSAKVKIQS